MESFLEAVAKINDSINGVVWGIPMMVLIVGAGLYLSIRTGFIQFSKFGYAIKNTLGKVFKKETVKKGEMTPFQALTTALAATVGTGNIAGVTGAIALGGPGAVFWMWISALVGMVTKYSEIVLAVKYRERNADGDWVGGPMYYIKNGLGKNWKWLAVVFAIFGALAAFGIGNIAQANTIAGSINTAIQAFNPAAADQTTTINLIIGVVCALFIGTVVIGGLTRIGKVTEKLVPIMSVVYIIASLVVIFSNIDNIGMVFKQIFVGAFSFKAAVGGSVGILIMQTIKSGVGRGLFSNEAGLGSAPMAHATTSESNPVKQGVFGIFEVFADTLVICTLTALALLCSGITISYGESAGAELTISAFSTTFGSKGAGIVIAIGITLFALSTMLSWSLYGTRCAEYLFGHKSIKVYQVVFIIVAVLGATMDLGLAWSISDTLNGLMAIPNLVALIGLSGVVVKLTREHFDEQKELKRAAPKD